MTADPEQVLDLDADTGNLVSCGGHGSGHRNQADQPVDDGVDVNPVGLGLVG